MWQFSVQPVSEQHHAALLDVYVQCEDFLALGPQPKASPEMVRQDLEHSRQSGGTFCGIFNPAGELLGVLDYIPASFEGQADQAYISLLMIAAPFRRAGLGAQVVAWLEAHLRQAESVTALLASVQVNNPHAERFWLQQGFEVIGPPELQPDGTTSRLMRKWLPR